MERISENYKLIILDDAQDDIDEYVNTIRYVFDAPLTAKKHYNDLYDLFRKIEKNPTAFSVRTNTSLFQYGYNIRRVNYKKMAILYSITDSMIYVHRVIAASMVTD
jgi:hypothetical protein